MLTWNHGSKKIDTVVIGVGNPLMGDDGLGLVVLNALRESWGFFPDVELIDGGTWGMNLLPSIEDADRLILLDAVQAGEVPGTPVTLEGASVPRFLSTKLSPHQIDLREVLAVAELRGRLPAQLVVFGAQPERVSMSQSLTPSVSSSVDEIVWSVVDRLAEWGHVPQRLAGASCMNSV